MRPSRPSAWPAIALVALLVAAQARADDPPRAPAEEAVRRLGEALAFVAAGRGEAAALDLARDLPPRLHEALRAVARAPRAEDLRQLGALLDAQAAMVPALIDEAPGARAALEAFAADAGARLDREVGAVERDVARVRAGASALQAEAARHEVISRLAVAARPGGEELLRLARTAPLVEADLARTRGAPERYEALADGFERRADPLVGATLVALARARDEAARELRALGGRDRVAALVDDVERRLSDACAALREAANVAADAVRQVRDEELLKVVQRARGAELEQAVRMYSAYRRQFRQPPPLRATRWADVYEDVESARLHFWLEGEDRWVQGPPRVDPLVPVVEALLAAEDPALRARAVDPGALARVYLLFDARFGRSRPFSEGLAATVARAQAAARRWRTLAALGDRAGVPRDALEEALLVRSGLAPSLLGLHDAPAGAQELDRHVARHAREALLRAAVERGPDAGADLARALEEAADDLEALAIEPVQLALEGRPHGAAVDLVWSPDPDGPEGRLYLVRPPARLAAGEPDRAAALLVTSGGGGPPRVEVWAHAWADGAAHVARATLAPGASETVRFAPAAGPSLVATGRLGPRGLRIVQVPRDAPPLEVVLRPNGAAEPRPLAPAPGGAWAALAPDEPGGECEVLGLDAQGQPRARLVLSLPAARGVQVTSQGPGGAWWVPPGSAMEARVVVGGAAAGGRHVFVVRGPGGVTHQREAEVLRWKVDLPPGRYEVAVDGAAPAPLAVMSGPPRVSLVVSPHGAAAVPGLPAGGHGFLRLDAWPAVAAHEVRRVRWTLEGGPEPQRAVTRPGVSTPDTALLLPVRLEPEARPGARRVTAVVETARGALTVTGAFDVLPPARPVDIELRSAEGEPLGALALGAPPALLRARPALRGAAWVVVGPSGRARALAARSDGQAPLSFLPHDLPGVHEVWLSGVDADGRPAAGRVRVLAHPPVELAVPPPAGARIGAELTIDLPVPDGFEPPMRARVDGAPWTDGPRVKLVANADNDVALTLEDARGRRARARLRFAATRDAPTEPVSRERYGIAANVTQRRIFAADYDLLQAYRKNDNLPRDWVVLEPGPLPAAKVRDRIFATIPYDGPSADPQVAYRSRRFWANLQESARRGLLARGVREGDPFEVMNSPSPAGEETLTALVARLLAEQGAWEYRLLRVRVVRADGAVPDRQAPRDPKEELRFFKVTASGEGAAVERVEVPGPVGDLQLRPVLPPTITLGQSARLAFTTLTTRAALVPDRRYPDGAEAVLRQALLCPELQVEVDVGGQRLAATARRVGRAVGGVDVAVAFEHVETERVEQVAGRPRRAERYRVAVEPFTHDSPPAAPFRFEPIPPGLLENEPQTIVVTARAVLVPAVPLAAWPADRPRPEPVTIEGAPFVLVREKLPEVAIEVQATYQRQAPDGPKPWPAVLPPVGAVRAGSEAPPPVIDAAQALAAAVAALDRAALDEAEEAARRAVYARPDDPAAWAALADVLLQRRRPLEALGRARWALALGASPRAHVVAAEAAWADGRLDEARAAAEAAGAIDDPRLELRLERLRARMGM